MEATLYSGKIKQLREERVWSQAHLAQAARVSARTIQRIEAGGKASHETLLSIAAAFKVDVHDLRTSEQDKKNDQNSQEHPEKQDEQSQNQKRKGLSPSIIFLLRVSSGVDLFKVVGGADAGAFEHDELTNQEEVDLVSSFLQDLHDYSDNWNDLEPKDKVRATYDFTRRLRELEDAGLWTFVGLDKRKFVARHPTLGDDSLELTTAYVYVLRSTNPLIVKPEAPLAAFVAVKLPKQIRFC